MFASRFVASHVHFDLPASPMLRVALLVGAAFALVWALNFLWSDGPSTDCDSHGKAALLCASVPSLEPPQDARPSR